MAIPVEVMASKKIIYIDRDEYHPDDNPLSIEGNPFYFKDIESLDKYFNELLGSLLASKFDLKTAWAVVPEPEKKSNIKESLFVNRSIKS